MTDLGKVVVVACAGMDKPLGSVARVSAFKAVEELRPKQAQLACIPPLMAGAVSHSELVKSLPVITLDGCIERCATKLVAKSGGKIMARIYLPDITKKHNLLPESASHIGSNGERLAELIAQEIALLVDRFAEEA